MEQRFAEEESSKEEQVGHLMQQVGVSLCLSLPLCLCVCLCVCV